MFESMRGKVALITGATQGIGKEAAYLFAETGMRLCLGGRSTKAGEALASEILQSGGEAIFIPLDVSKSSSVRFFVEQAVENFGHIDYAFNNAGIEGRLAPLADLEEEDIQEVMSTNFLGVWFCMKYVLPYITKQGGAIVNTSTNISNKGFPRTGAYSASKAAVDAITRVAACENGASNVRINCVNPGAIDTAMIRRVYDSPKDLEALRESNPLRALGQPRSIAETVLFLLSPLASHINGACLYIDGGSSLI